MHDTLLRIRNQILYEAKHKELFESVLEAINSLEEKKQLRGNWHPLGFIHIPLGTINNQTLRLHVWSKQERKIQQPLYPIHTHIFELKSHILSGSLKNSIYAIKKQITLPLQNVIYDVDYNHNNSILKRTKNTINIKKISEETLNKGDYYFVKKGDFHSSVVKEGEFTATIALAYQYEHNTPIVIGEISGNERYHYSRNNCSDEELTSIISNLKKL